MNSQIKILRKQIECRLISHAYLFSGDDDGAKQRAVEFLLEQFLDKNYFTSPDLYTVRGKLTSNGVYQISISDVRALRDRASRTPLYGEKNVFLINNLEAINREAATLLLKLVEEPSQYNMYIATTSNINAINPTIKSRFSHMRFWSQVSRKDDFGAIKQISKLPYAKRFARVSDILKNDSFSKLVSEALRYFYILVRAETTRDNVLKIERLLKVYRALRDPTINKRLLGEYFMMII